MVILPWKQFKAMYILQTLIQTYQLEQDISEKTEKFEYGLTLYDTINFVRFDNGVVTVPQKSTYLLKMQTEVVMDKIKIAKRC